jgi:CheY-like chemotaxis protein
MKTVLYVEDHPVNTLLVEAIFASRPDVRLLTTTLGATGLDMAQQHRPDLILLDLHLPDMTGDVFMRKLRTLEAAANVPVIIVSADALHERQTHLRDLGVAEYITKPFDLSDFERKLDLYLGPTPQA